MHDEHGHTIIDEPADLAGWEILEVEDWKPGVKRLHCRRENAFMLAYCKEHLLPGRRRWATKVSSS